MSNEIDSSQGAQDSTHDSLITDQLRASLAKPGTYVLDCRTMNEHDWRQLYPPIAKELRSLPGSGLPFWHYEWNYCVCCENTLRNCRSNPFGFYGPWRKSLEKTKSRTDQSTNRRREAKTAESSARNEPQEQRVATTSKTEPALSPVMPQTCGHEFALGGPSEDKTATGRYNVNDPCRSNYQKDDAVITACTYQQTMPHELEAVIVGEYENRGTIRSIAEHHRIAAAAVRDFLARRGVLRKPGDHLKQPRAAAATEVIEPSESPPTVPEKARTGKPRTILCSTRPR